MSFARRRQEYQNEVDRRVGRLRRVRVHQMPPDVYGLESLALISQQSIV